LALEDAFPDMDLTVHTRYFKRKQHQQQPSLNGEAKEGSVDNTMRHHWENIDNRRNFFLEFAKEMGFDPYDPNSWHDVSVMAVEKKVYLFSVCFFLCLFC
jgi:type IV secretory pathway VirD2 relaxase